MNRGVKALPVVAWTADACGSPVDGLVRQSDAESALAELRAEVELQRQRADTAEARLERARGLLNEASIHVYSLGLLDRISAFLGEGK